MSYVHPKYPNTNDSGSKTLQPCFFRIYSLSLLYICYSRSSVYNVYYHVNYCTTACQNTGFCPHVVSYLDCNSSIRTIPQKIPKIYEKLASPGYREKAYFIIQPSKGLRNTSMGNPYGYAEGRRVGPYLCHTGVCRRNRDYPRILPDSPRVYKIYVILCRYNRIYAHLLPCNVMYVVGGTQYVSFFTIRKPDCRNFYNFLAKYGGCTFYYQTPVIIPGAYHRACIYFYYKLFTIYALRCRIRMPH
uniref:PD205R n=1 Tax=African swine fever virus TaxID=10497 RepID=A0A6G7KU58_ASF